MYFHVEGYGFFRSEYPALRNDGTKETKEITAYSIEKEVFNVDWVGLKINTAEEDSQEMLIDGNVTGYAMPINLISFHNPYDERFSLLNILISKTPLWSVGYVDPYIYRKTDDNGDFIQQTKKATDGTDVPQTVISQGHWEYTDDGEFEYKEETLTEPKYELKSVGMYSEDNVSIYAFLTSTLGPKVGCLFFFDTERRLIHAVSKYSIEKENGKYDTGIYVGFRNLANSVDLSVEEDSVVTRVNCQGGDGLKFLDLNYGSSRLIDLSYFAHEPYMTEATATKVIAWQNLIAEKRAEYKALAEESVRISDEISDITYKVPADENYWKTWNGLNEEALNKSLAYYRNEIAMLQESVDDTPQYDEDGKYVSYNQGKTDEWYENKLAMAENGYGGYGTYYETVTYIIPNILIALNNLYIVSTDPNYQQPIQAVEYDWELYGIVELQAQIKNLTTQFDSLKNYYGSEWPDVETPEAAAIMGAHAWNKEFYLKQRQEYLRLYNEIGPNGSAYIYLDELYLKRDGTDRQGNPVSDEAVSESLNGQLSAVMEQMAPYKAYNDLESFFTEEEMAEIYPLLIDTDYSNTNIQIQETDTAVTKIGIEQELLDDCLDKVSELSQPQITFTSELDNLYRIDAFKDLRKDLKLLNYIHLGVRDDYPVKLRVVGISWNPCDINSSLTLEFSNMITSRSGRSDFTDIISAENNRGQKNGISIGANGQIAGTGNSIDYLTNLMEALSGTGIFKKAVKNTVSNPVTGVASNVTEDEFMYALKTVPGMSRFVLDSAQVAELDSGETIMTGGKIKTGFINAKYIAVDQISSPMYEDDPLSVYSLSGMRINLNAPRTNPDTGLTEYVGTITAPNFAIDEDGNAYLRGTIRANRGELGQFIINDLGVTSSVISSVYDEDEQVYVEDGTFINGMYSITSNNPYFLFSGKVDDVIHFDPDSTSLTTEIEQCNFYVTKTGKLYAKDAEVSGQLNATSGNVAGWIIDGDRLYKNTYILDAGGTTTTTINNQSRANLVLSIGSNFGVNTSGHLFANGVNINGTVRATSLTADTDYNIFTGNTSKNVIKIGDFSMRIFSFTNGVQIGNITDGAFWSCGQGSGWKVISTGADVSVYAGNFNADTSIGAPTAYIDTISPTIQLTVTNHISGTSAGFTGNVSAGGSVSAGGNMVAVNYLDNTQTFKAVYSQINQATHDTITNWGVSSIYTQQNAGGNKYLGVLSNGVASGVYFNVSDKRLKKNIKSSDLDALNVVNKINTYSFDWKDNGVNVELGFIADDLMKTIPYAVNEIKQPEEAKIDNIKSIDYNVIIPYLTKAIQQLSEQVKSLKKHLEMYQKTDNGR